MTDIKSLLWEAAQCLSEKGSASPRLDAEVLLALSIKKNTSYLIANSNEVVSAEYHKLFNDFLYRRIAGEPIAYITGEKEFWSLPFKVNRTVLIPRPETELLVEETLSIVKRNFPHKVNILELGVGSGAISCALAHELKNCTITATDISPDALAIARENALALGIANKINFVRSNLFEMIGSSFEVIVSNPPYIAVTEYETLLKDIREYEPRLALIANDNGMYIEQKIIVQAVDFLQPNGWLLLEIGAQQKEKIEAAIMTIDALDDVAFCKDYAGRWRVAKARKIK